MYENNNQRLTWRIYFVSKNDKKYVARLKNAWHILGNLRKLFNNSLITCFFHDLVCSFLLIYSFVCFDPNMIKVSIHE